MRYVTVLAAIFLLASCSQPKALVYQDIRNFRVHSVDLSRLTLVADLKFYNPNGFGLQLKNGDVDAYFNDQYLGKANIDERTTIPAKDTFLLPVSVTANIGSLLGNAAMILSKKNTEVLVRLQGNVKAGKAGVFFTVPVQYSGTQKIQF